MKYDIKFILLFSLIVSLTGCVNLPKQDVNPELLAGKNTIAVIRPPEVVQYIVVDYEGHPGMAFGLIAAGDMDSKQKQLTTAMTQLEPPSPSSLLADHVAEQLNKTGYTARVEQGPWKRGEDNADIKFSEIKSDADLVLVLMPTILGFIAPGSFSDYVPSFVTTVILLGKNREEQLYRGFHAYGWKPNVDGFRFPPASRSFANFDALIAEPVVTANALKDAAPAIAVTIAEDLKK